ncbi:Glycine-rich protein family [Euphorbia peplus]|nr:Glycine-rich protein family [Euphorbia peplus]
MNKPPKRPSGRTNLASCIVASIFLIFIIIIILIVFFTVFKPKDPRISVNSVQLPSFSISNNTVNFTFSQYVSVKNPNRAVFSHFDSSLQLMYAGSQVGFMFIPAGKVDSGQTQYMAASFSVQSFPLSKSPAAAVNVAAGDGFSGDNVGPNFAGNGFPGGFRVGPTMEIESRIHMVGRIRVLRVFTHHVEAKSGCRVAISVSDGSVLGFHC